MFSEEIGSRIREIRLSNGLSQRELGQRLQTSTGHISWLEAGKAMPGGELLLQLHREFAVDINWLLTGSEPESVPPEGEPDVRRLVDHYCRADMQAREIIRTLASYAGRTRS
ncbi:XRE family transcriptional regulator [Herbaspirillum rubrisubalbicans]|jgi:transcriptional regulator with XRE-family HTH domain|uniref:XRE family transcriptional regulator n=2 Tax=Herbaspirillum rubrisubalbicans TaxID=80842 RepID=A0AAD0XI94_9BURK|nr:MULTISPECIES: helix-turn-helix transcriptional regulator [Herbaspirillum]ALU90223.1 XRE family transcription regulator protein [Herbaspirillum rubrisubalbicans M1]AYR25253.1 XRE family transcriptional regulator [Herbaspirillum rubrisubalbicans]MCP1573402.1 transcriptional regulator with XRE-family HTH domain [Herbaspirillum rubrisubalbicans]NQE47709.1 XRE family transcriptional regulator [Herbaspirillum rubrisubalbicans]QJQ01897.1 XRE family transcriptional regulator [Herbaspirillum rubrisu